MSRCNPVVFHSCWVNGPSAETKEVIGGFWLWQVKNMGEAPEWARRWPANQNTRSCRWADSCGECRFASRSFVALENTHTERESK